MIQNYDKDTVRIQKQMHMGGAGVRNPTANEKILAHRTRLHDVGDVLGVESADRRIKRRQDAERSAWHPSKDRKRPLKD